MIRLWMHRLFHSVEMLVPAVVLIGLFGVLLGCDRRGAGQSKPPVATPAPQPQLVPLTNMVLIKAGTFLRIKYPVTLTHDFWMGQYEVRQGEYVGIMGRNPSHFAGDPNLPVEKVTFFDASNYCAIVTQRERVAGRIPVDLEYRLPTEAEWEYACRAGATNLFAFGDDAKLAEMFAWTSENSEGRTHPVGSKRPNDWGLYDMHGNVWEWCLDGFEPYPAVPLIDPIGPKNSKYKVFKGGGWNQESQYARSANRFMMSPSSGIHFVGFRMVLGRPAQRQEP